MDSYQGLIARRLLPDIGQDMGMAAGSSSSPTRFRSDPSAKPMTAITLAFIIATFFLLGFLSVHFKRCCGRRGSRGGPHLGTVLHNPSEPARGLDVCILETLPKIIFSSSSSVQPQQQKKEKKKQMVECAICLEEFEDQETLRLLPLCGHAFHLECISMWFLSHTNCPLCRHSVLDLNAIAIAIAVPCPSNSVSTAVDSAPPAEALQVGMPGNGSEEGESSEGNRAQIKRSDSTGNRLTESAMAKSEEKKTDGH